MNRTDRIFRCLSSWHKFDLIDEIILVDWDSKPSILENKQVADFFQNTPKVKVKHITDQKFFSLSKSYNAGIKETKNSKVLKIDIDYVLKGEAFLKYLETLDLTNQFYTTNSQIHKAQNWDYPFFGLCYFNKDHFLNCNGYDESFEGWGYEDTDLYFRLEKYAKRIIMPKGYERLIHHIPHMDYLRTANYQIKNKKLSLGINYKKFLDKHK